MNDLSSHYISMKLEWLCKKLQVNTKPELFPLKIKLLYVCTVCIYCMYINWHKYEYIYETMNRETIKRIITTLVNQSMTIH